MAKIFLSYSHADERFCDMLQKHLAALKHQGLIETWHDRRIKAGDDFESAIDQQLNEAEIILLLVSSDFIASRYCYDIEMARAMERHQANEARVIPVIVRSCDWHDTPFGALLAAPEDGKPIASWPDIDEAFLDVVRKIKAVLREFGTTSADVSTEIPAPFEEIAIEPQIVDRPRSANLTIRKTFSEADKDDFIEGAFEYISKYFETSLTELQDRNPQLSTRFRRIDANRFTAVVYLDGKAASRCKISMGAALGFGRSITYSVSESDADNSFNESLSVEADDQHMFLQAMGMTFRMQKDERNLTLEGGAELYWSIFLDPLQ